MQHCSIKTFVPPLQYGWQSESDSDQDEDKDEGAFDGDVPWERKTNERLGWRGRTTGMHASPDWWWTYGHRTRLVTLANALEGNESGSGEVGEPESVPPARVNPAWLDVALTDRPISCDQDGGTCHKMERLWAFREVQGRHEEGRYKFILDGVWSSM